MSALQQGRLVLEVQLLTRKSIIVIRSMIPILYLMKTIQLIPIIMKLYRTSIISLMNLLDQH